MDIMKELEKKKKIFEKELARYLKECKPKKLYDAVRYLPLAGGKRLRPLLAITACESVGGDPKIAVPFAAAIELIHNFTLIHDDIIDRSNLRRNIPTVHVKFGEPTAIIAGDTLFAKAFEIIHDLDAQPDRIVEISYKLGKCVQEICEGQQLDMEFEGRKIVSEEEYIEMISKKTAALFKFALEGGATIGNGSSREIDSLASYGWNLGLSFQIRDDYLDIQGEESVLGKDIGNDIRNGKKTILIVHAMKNADEFHKKVLLDILGKKNASDKEIKEVLEVLVKTGSVEYAKQLANKYYENACKALDVIKDTPAKELLKEIAKYSIKRKK
jgi:geranylgeranyl diphosphate synthase type I